MRIGLGLALSFIITISACSENKDELNKHSKSETGASFKLPEATNINPETKRWYSNEQILNGEKTFGQICAACHKKDASGTKNWKESKNGVFPPPPLDGNAHTWHHPLSQLHQTIKEGTTNLGGNMPAWGKVLSDEKILETIAFFQSKWNDDIYNTWSGKKTD